MRTFGLALLIGLVAAVGVPAAHAAEKMTPQQNRMKECNEKAGEKKGDERKAFMSSCLSNKPPAPAAKGTPQQERMKECNTKAAGKKGDERKEFMSQCLRN